jgi:hypothetical protein
MRAVTLAMAAVCAAALSGASVLAQAQAKAAALTAQDRTDIQKLVADYATFLGTCAAQDYARLFEPDGVFASGPRGSVSGRDRLVALVESERHCNGTGERRARPAPTVEIEAIPGGAKGTAVLGNDGTYIDDTYVKTKSGWRFKLRQVITGQEKAATLTGDDFQSLRRLAGGTPFGDVWANTPEGWRFRSSGVVIAGTPAGVTGRTYLKDGGRYDDVYERTANGWRLKSRTFVAEVLPGPGGVAQQIR